MLTAENTVDAEKPPNNYYHQSKGRKIIHKLKILSHTAIIKQKLNSKKMRRKATAEPV